MSDYKKTGRELRRELCRLYDDDAELETKWLRADVVKKEIEKHITEKNYGTAWANTWRKELLESLGLLDDVQSGEEIEK